MSEMDIGICVTVLWEMRNNVFPVVLAMSVYDLETKCSSRMASLRDPVSPGVQLSSSASVYETCLRAVLFCQAVF